MAKGWTPARLKALRRRLGLSLRAAGKEVGVRWTTWFEWEKGTHAPSKLAVMALDTFEANTPENPEKKAPKVADLP